MPYPTPAAQTSRGSSHIFTSSDDQEYKMQLSQDYTKIYIVSTTKVPDNSCLIAYLPAQKFFIECVTQLMLTWTDVLQQT